MFAYISANEKIFSVLARWLPWRFALAGYALSKNIKRGCAIPRARAVHTHARLQFERLLQTKRR